jgi:hypothetical protein
VSNSISKKSNENNKVETSPIERTNETTQEILTFDEESPHFGESQFCEEDLNCDEGVTATHSDCGPYLCCGAFDDAPSSAQIATDAPLCLTSTTPPVVHNEDTTSYDTPAYDASVEAVSVTPAFILAPGDADAHYSGCRSVTFASSLPEEEDVKAGNGCDGKYACESDGFCRDFPVQSNNEFDYFLSTAESEREEGYVVHFHINPGTTVNFTTNDGAQQRISGECFLYL